MPRRRPPAAPDADDLIVDSATPFQPLERLNRQLKAAAAGLRPSDVRYLVDTYYQLQQQRIAAAHQLRQTAPGEPPNPFMAWFQQNCKHQEGNIKAAMGIVAQQSVPGRWCLSITGIGPVITAGLLAHIDITRTKYPSNLWSFAGVNPDRRWLPHTKRPWNARLKVLCCHPDTTITTRRGYVPIRDVQVGDEVLTHRGRWRPVTQVFVNPHDGDLIGLPMHGRASQMPLLTPGHPVYAKQVPTYAYTQRDGRERVKVQAFARPNGLDAVALGMREMHAQGATMTEIAAAYGYRLGGVYDIVNGRTRTQPNPLYKMGWMAVETIQPGWRGYSPFVPDEGTVPRLTFTRIFRGKRIPPDVTLTPDLARLVGLYLSEGHVSTGKYVGFSFHEQEEAYLRFVEQQLAALGLHSKRTVHPPNHSAQIVTVSTALATTITRLFGTGAAGKQLPAAWLGMRRDLVAAVLRGLFEGDGCIQPKNIRYGTISKQLAYQIRDLLARLGISASINTWHHVFHVLVHDGARFRQLVWQDHETPGWPSSSVKERDDTGAWYQCRPAVRVPYTGPVYNLEVAEDESYVAEGLAVHNCFKIGESFTKFANHPNDHYGQYYKRRKRYEVDKNVSGARVQTAAEWLERVNFGKDTDAYKWYSGCYTKVQGERYFGAILGGTAPPRLTPGAPGSGLAMLPPQQVHRRAQRFAAKLFLSHLHSVMFEAHYGRPGPPAWVLAYGDHFETWLEEPPVPNWPLAA